MVRPSHASLAALLLGALAACSSDRPAPLAPGEPVTAKAAAQGATKYVVSFKADAVPADFASRVAALGGAVDASYGNVGVAVVSGLSDAAVASLATASSIDEIGADDEFQFLDPAAVTEVAASEDAAPASPTDPTTAVRYPRQWHLRQIEANKAWAAGILGSPSVKVAILDTGIDYLHPDLAGRVDLANSASFVPSDDALVARLFPTRNPVTDLHYHGTHVAATVSSNAILAAGVTSQTTLMAVKVLSASGSGSTAGVLAGVVYAADHGADVINMSLGNRFLYSTRIKGNKDYFNKVLDRAFKYAHSKGVTVVIAAGNESQDLDVKKTYTPYCSAKHAICVSATGPTAGGTLGPWVNPDAFAPYSNFGLNEVSVAAPGGNSGGSVWEACSTSSLVIPDCQRAALVVGLRGTSMAAPHTAGLAALLVAKHGHGKMGVVRSTIERTADDLGAPGEDAYYGRGRINVANALGLN